MTFLELVNFVRQECDVSMADLSTLSGVVGEDKRIMNWVIRSWNDIQNKHIDWKFLRGTFSFVTTANDGSYSSSDAGISTRFRYWARDYCTVYLTASGVNDQTEIRWLDYETFRSYYLTGTQSNQRPQHFTAGLSNELLLGPAPDSALYTIAGQYVKAPQVLNDSTDIPDLPEQHEVIAYLAMTKYGNFEVAQEVIARGKAEYRRIMADLRLRYLPEIQLSPPPA